MVKSRYIHDILVLLLDGDEQGLAISPQLPFISEREYRYTSAGVYVYFNKENGIQDHIYSNKDAVLSGVVIRSPGLELGAEATLFVTDGYIDYLELFSRNMEYPDHELTNYTLTQEWKGGPNKQIDRSV